MWFWETQRHGEKYGYLLVCRDKIPATTPKPNIRWDYDGIENDPTTNTIPKRPTKLWKATPMSNRGGAGSMLGICLSNLDDYDDGHYWLC